MNEEKAREILDDWILPDNDIYRLGVYISWRTQDNEAVLDGNFTVDQLEAVAWWMRNKAKRETGE